MLLYFEFEEKRRKADVTWPKKGRDIVVHITDNEIAKQLPTDLYYEMEDDNKIVFTVEDPANKRLVELQTTIKKRLQDISS
ncbi:MAG TPA: hypothetical protein VF623_14990 [Segetibacter sp.]|jgi:hypothetical protein